ncbi:peptidoglycan-binding protein [Ensifer sp. IC4062]|nr:peptidoglycan-binding protein [Ensifer sp. IC4062]MCA1441538.1 peptidoglycan-binding protein [Ensifer sp. IC4062]
MAPRKRKQAERKRAARNRPGLALRGLAVAARGLAFTGRMLARHPVGAGGSAAFVIVFSFVAANAMWYQHGAHPSPLLRTRIPLVGPEVAERLAAANGEPVEPRNVTTFVIEREGAERPANGDHATTAQSEPGEQAKTASATHAAASTLVADVQRELARLGLYDGAPDGHTGPKTSAAILRFEKQAGGVQSGEASDELLQALRATADTGLAVATPGDRPYSAPKATPAEVDPVAAAIRTAEEDGTLLPRADIPASSEMVESIQKGLSNLAYADIVVDGVAGDQTRAAIRHFEKHYRLPQTGEPNAKVLKKLKEIGAL